MMNRIYLFITFVLICTFFHSEAQTSWTPVSPDFFPTNASGQIHGLSRVSQVKFHPSNPNKVYAVSSRGGLFISSNAGTNWTLAPGCDIMPVLRLNSVCIDYTNDQTLYLGTGDANYYYSGNGVYKSTNGGNTFIYSGLSGRLVVELLMNPANNQMLIAATDQGIYKSIDAGATWTLKTSTALACRDMLFKANAGTQTLYACTYSDLYRSTDMGETWTALTSGIYIPSGYSSGAGCRIAVTPADSNLLYFAMIAKNGTIFKSINGGNSFVNMKDTIMPNLTAYDNLSTSTGQGDYNCMFNVDPINPNILYFGAHNFWKSVNGGANWTQMTNWYAILHTDMHWVKVNPYNTSQIWTANDGGVWVSTDGGTNWTPKSDGIYGYEIYHGNCSPTRRDMFSIGTQDNGELYHSSGTWFTNRGGDWGSQCAFDYRANSSMVYYYQNNERRLVNGGDQTYGLPISSLQDIGFYRGYTNLAFAANLDVYRTTTLQNTIPTWTQISTINKTIKAVHVNLADSNKLYVITNDANIYVSTNALSAIPTFTNYALPSSTSSSVTLTSIKSSPNTIYAVLNTLVYRSTDNGATWTNVSYNLPSVNWVKILPDEYFSSNELVFLAANNTVYYKKGSQTSWTLFSTALPARTLINDFSIYDDGTNQSALRVSEYGRGMWEVPMTALRTATSAFSVNENFPCPGTAIQFNDQSSGNVTTWNWTFNGGTPSSSTLQNPTVTYNTNGFFDVTLLISDGTSSNTLTKTEYINTNGGGLPLNEGFESLTFPPSGWTSTDAANDGFKWLLNSSAGGFGVTSSSMYFNNFSNNSLGTYDEMRTPRFDMLVLNTALLTFDVAYQPYNSTNFSDTLEVLISTNCGASFTSVYLKGGATLTTVAGTNTSPFVPTAAQWRKETINLNSYINGSVLLAFRNRGNYGNNLYIDNINLTGSLTTNAGIDKSICYGNSTSIGSAAVAGVSYSWSPTTGLNSATISNPAASPPITTSYVLTATKTGSTISVKDTVVVTVDSVPITIVITPVSCVGGNNGAIDLTNNAGIAPYSYLWNNSATTEDRTGLSPGTYSVTITNGASCSRQYSFAITQPSAALSATASSTQKRCNINNATATALPIGGTAPYSYLWSNGGTSATITNLSTGNFTVLITDARSCTTTASTVISAKPLPVINSFIASPSTLCEGNPVTLTVNASGGDITNTFSSGTINLAIPDNVSSGVSTTIPISSSIRLNAADKLTVTLNFGTTSVAPNREHTWVGDLKVSLTTPGGSTILFDRPGYPASGSGNSADMNGLYTFSISVADILPALSSATSVVSGNVVTGNYKPSNSANPDAAHNWTGLIFPLDVTGNWTLSLADLAGSDVGDLIVWSVAFSTLYTHQYAGSGTLGTINCINSNCSNASVIFTNASPGNNIYNVITTTPDGCTVTANSNVTVNQLPVQPVSISGPATVCEYDTLAYSTGIISGAIGFTWTVPPGWNIISGQGNSTINVRTPTSSGNVSVAVVNSCGTGPLKTIAVTSGSCIVNLTVKAFLEALYQSGTLRPALFNQSLNASPTAVDSVTIELRDSIIPHNLRFVFKGILNSNGNIQSTIPNFQNGVYYIVLRHRNSIDTWSKAPVYISAPVTNFDFTSM